MKIYGLVLTAFCFLVLSGFMTSVSAQNMEHTVVTKEVKFAKGTHKATLTGSAKYAMSYVFTLGANEGQTMDVKLTSKNPKLTFSVMSPPDDDTMENGFGVTEFSGDLPRKGKYTIVVVMNDENAGSVPYKLEVTIQ